MKHRLTEQVEAFIAYKQGLGFAIKVEAAELRRFARFARKNGYDGPLSADLALNWASERPTFSRLYRARRLEVVRNFGRYALAVDGEAQLPPAGVFGSPHSRTEPYIYSQQDVIRLMNAAGALLSPDGLRAAAISTAIGLMWVAGLRVSEACNLRRDDVNLAKAELYIRNTKYRKERHLPLHTTAVNALKRYADLRDSVVPFPDSEHFFLSSFGNSLALRNLEYGFVQIRNCLLPQEQEKWGRRPPRMADLRHSFATHTLARWLEDGVDVNHRILLPSTYLGHRKPTDTYWYLSGSPRLLDIATLRFERFIQGVKP